MRKILTVAMLLLVGGLWAAASDPVNTQWQQTVLNAIDSFPERGGYYTGGKPNAVFAKTTWQGLKDAFVMDDNDTKPRFDPYQAQPSFCSSATYAVLVKALLMWDTTGKISREAWQNMRVHDGQNDGVGFWGRANANGPALAVLVNELDAGYSVAAYRGALADSVKECPAERYLTDAEWRAHPVWCRARAGDMMKIFWNRHDSRGHDGGAIIGDDGVRRHLQEAGHSVVFLGYDENGRVRYWSSNGPGKEPEKMGYGEAVCDKTAIQRVVFTRILHPERFDRVRNMPPTHVNQYLYDLNGHRHSSTEEMWRMIGQQ